MVGSFSFSSVLPQGKVIGVDYDGVFEYMKIRKGQARYISEDVLEHGSNT